MPLTDEQRAEINRQNASKSTGPKSEEGKANSRRNALKHGLRAEVVALPNEDPEVIAARSESWNEYYKPQSPGAQHLVNECVAATLLSDRCHKYHAAALSKQVRDAPWDYDNRQREQVAALVVHLRKDPLLAIRRLAQTAAGCHELIERWERLDRIMAETGRWHGPERDEAIRLQGFHPDLAKLKECPPAWITWLYALCCDENPSSVALNHLFRSDRFPETHRGEYAMGSLPVPEDCRRLLREMIAQRLEPLRILEEEIRNDQEAPDLAEAQDRAMILHDGPSARLFLRYHSEARNSFQKAYGSLLKTLDRDASGSAEDEAETAAAVEPPNEAEASAPPARESSPNEANSAQNPAKTTVSAPSSDRMALVACPPVSGRSGNTDETAAGATPPLVARDDDTRPARKRSVA